MADVKALFPVGKTQWAKWNDAQRTTFNEVRAAGVPFIEAIQYVNTPGFIVEEPKQGFLARAIDIVEDVADVAVAVAPVAAVAKTAVKAVTKAKKGK